ncbi:ARM repeat-containing protein [Amylostereum chailletii]|nr:ARM repeat-containing protein [Amylostereum chailletii]
MNGTTQPQAQNASLQMGDLYNIVAGAASQDPVVMQAASTRLKEVLKLSGVLSGLQQITTQTSVPLHIRQLAIIQCKNEIPNQWRHRKLISEEDKAAIRERSLALLGEEDDAISRCNVIIVAKIARYDYPHNWHMRRPALVTTLMNMAGQAVQQRSATTQADFTSFRALTRCLGFLKAILKEFAHIRMLSGVKLMLQIHSTISEYYTFFVNAVVAALNAGDLASPRMIEDIQICQYLFKCISVMAVWVWQAASSNRRDNGQKFEDWVVGEFQRSASHLKILSDARVAHALAFQTASADADARRSLEYLVHYIRTLGKFFRRLQQLDVRRFVTMPLCDDLVSYYWNQVIQANNVPQHISESPTAVYPTRLIVQAMVLFKESLAQWSPARRKGPEANVLPEEFVRTAVTFLVTRFMPLRPTDLEGWLLDPEEWVNVEDKDDQQWEFEIRPCAERVLMTFSAQYPQYTNPLLAEAFKNANVQPPDGLDAILQKESVYCAVGRCARRLMDSVDFSGWLDIATVEAQNPDPNYVILKRRIVWLIGRWLADDCASTQDVRIWQILVHLLTNRDQGTEVVRLTAASALKQCVDVLTFEPDVFTPFLVAVLPELVHLMDEVESLESKRKVNDCLNTIISRVEGKIAPFVSLITDPLPQLWLQAGSDFMFKNSLLTTLTDLVTALGENSGPLSAIVVPLVQEGLSPGFAVQLDDHTFKLWMAALRHATTLQGYNGGQGLIDLFPLLVSLLSQNLDVLGKITSILESYFLLGANESYSAALFSAFLQALQVAFGPNVKGLLGALELLFQHANASIYVEALHTSGLFAYFIKSAINDKLDVQCLTTIIFVVARIALANRDHFMQLMAATVTSQGIPEAQVWEGLLDQWWRRFDNMYEPRHRKLAAMGIAVLVSTGRGDVLDRLPTEIFNIWTDVFAELKEEKEKRSSDLDSDDASLTMYWDQPPTSFFQGTEDTLEYGRRQSCFDNDPVRKTLLTSFIAQRLQEAEMACGGSQVMQTQYLAKADPHVLKQIVTEVFGR